MGKIKNAGYETLKRHVAAGRPIKYFLLFYKYSFETWFRIFYLTSKFAICIQFK